MRVEMPQGPWSYKVKPSCDHEGEVRLIGVDNVVLVESIIEDGLHDRVMTVFHLPISAKALLDVLAHAGVTGKWGACDVVEPVHEVECVFEEAVTCLIVACPSVGWILTRYGIEDGVYIFLDAAEDLIDGRGVGYAEAPIEPGGRLETVEAQGLAQLGGSAVSSREDTEDDEEPLERVEALLTVDAIYLDGAGPFDTDTQAEIGAEEGGKTR